MTEETASAETFGQWLKGELARREWRPRDLARRMEASEGTISHWANDIRFPNPAAVRRIAAALGIDVDYLLTVAGHRPPNSALDPTSAEAQLLPLIRSIHWSRHGPELALLRRHLEFIAGMDVVLDESRVRTRSGNTRGLSGDEQSDAQEAPCTQGESSSST